MNGRPSAGASAVDRISPVEERFAPLEGCLNFRDLGGYPTTDGRRMRAGQLFRSDSLHRLTSADMVKLDRYELATVIDLRAPAEVAKAGRVPEGWRDITYYNIPMLDILPGVPDWPDEPDAAFLIALYCEILAGSHDALIHALRVMSKREAYPLVFHCSGGKDRAGIVAALVLALHGVPDQVIGADYALSTAPVRRMLSALLQEHPDLTIKQDSPWLNADPSVITGLLQSIRTEYGSIGDFAQQLGLTPTVRQMRELLLK